MTLAVAVPLPLATVQISFGVVGCVRTVTAYASVGPVTAVLKVKGSVSRKGQAVTAVIL